ncbi:hypothetical protein [Actinomadura sp. WMMA1423]|uniref:hypothetical protein n=1 Tax=Actinomadura sp. WMMA1423 TaxID=2591108 RepID=UPI00114655C0|nr:hypothetical protein [Actinomadura sp. WMMA1423]
MAAVAAPSINGRHQKKREAAARKQEEDERQRAQTHSRLLTLQKVTKRELEYLSTLSSGRKHRRLWNSTETQGSGVIFGSNDTNIARALDARFPEISAGYFAFVSAADLFRDRIEGRGGRRLSDEESAEELARLVAMREEFKTQLSAAAKSLGYDELIDEDFI